MRRLEVLPYRNGDLRLIKPSEDMRLALEAEGGDIPRDGPAWTVTRGGRVLGIGGYSRLGAARAHGWLLVADLSPMEWGAMMQALRAVLDRVRRLRTVARMDVLADGRRRGAVALLQRVGFEATGAEDGDVVMSMEMK